MAITRLLPDFKLPDPLVCAICSVNLTLDRATAGLLDHSGHQTFACVSHFSEVEKLIIGWADFNAHERFKLLHNGLSPTELISNGGHHARFDT